MKNWITLAVLVALCIIALIGCQTGDAPASKTPVVVKTPVPEIVFAEGAFPPAMPNIEEHRNAWQMKPATCLSCKGGGKPWLVHKDMPAELLLQTDCRNCHVSPNEYVTPAPRATPKPAK